MHKTGTTSVQKTLMCNDSGLELLGYRTFINLPQMNAKNIDSFNPDWLREQTKVAEKNGMTAIIFSAEVISTFNLKQLSSFLDAFYGYEVNLIACFRHWVGFLPSRWMQNCKRRDAQSFRKYLDQLKIHEDKHIDARFDLVVQRMIMTQPNNIKLISYNNSILSDSLVPTVLSSFDLPQNFVEKITASKNRYNTRIDINSVEIIRLFNGIFSQKNVLEYDDLFFSIYHAIPVKRFYDFHAKINTILDMNEELKKQLLSIINDTKTCILLSRKDVNIAKWEERVELISGEFIYNPRQSKLFCDVPDASFIYSKIEVDDLPTCMQKKMSSALGFDRG